MKLMVLYFIKIEETYSPIMTINNYKLFMRTN